MAWLTVSASAADANAQQPKAGNRPHIMVHTIGLINGSRCVQSFIEALMVATKS
jgi:hypothetical protein